MMTKKVAERLNLLRRWAEPIVEDSPTREDGSMKYPKAAYDTLAVFLWPVPDKMVTSDKISDIVRPILKKYEDAAIDAAIREAAEADSLPAEAADLQGTDPPWLSPDRPPQPRSPVPVPNRRRT